MVIIEALETCVSNIIQRNQVLVEQLHMTHTYMIFVQHSYSMFTSSKAKSPSLAENFLKI